MREREAALKFRDRQPILMSPEGRVDPRLSRIFRRSAFSAKAEGTQETYAPLYRVFFTFLWQRGLNWDQVTSEDLEDWEDWRRRAAANPKRIEGATWAKELAALNLLYTAACGHGFVRENPVLTRTVRTEDGGTAEVAELAPNDVVYADVKWLTPRAYRLWRNVGLGGLLPSGLEDGGWRGRLGGRDCAFSDLTYSSGMRRREAGTLLTHEIPELGRQNYYSGKVGQQVAKRARHTFYASHAALQRVWGYRLSIRAEAVRLAQVRGAYDDVPGQRIVQSITRQGKVLWTEWDGRLGEGSLNTLTAADRLRLYIRTEDGLEPAMLWLMENGMPFSYKSWTKVFERASDRCEALGLGVFATPHMLRHSMALRVLVALHNALDRRLGLTPAERRHYEDVYGQVWSMVKDMLGHKNEQVTRDIYLEPVRGLQLDSLLNDEDNPVDTEKLAELSARTGLILDAA
ncbi:site-specific integrase [Streptomyces sp. BPTC-684]|uniref:site-specific integrase n=1 Tax=Streptomyces sp. BPTC-684 TaxID=3043734 RepID=UPI0024B27E2C|nr:site-specific integrase [Streptomyces sp. BPTC-684]WHM36282.1 site-specific integrase [Streptomyces sp. BPTC-684]